MSDSPLPHPAPDAPAEPDGADDILAFTPVPTAADRHDGWTPRRQFDFIEALAAMGVVARAARAVGMSKQSAYQLRRRPGAESWARAWDLALQQGYTRQFDLAVDVALNGVTTPRYYRGRVVGTRHRYDYRLAFAAISRPPAPPQPGSAPRNKITE